MGGELGGAFAEGGTGLGGLGEAGLSGGEGNIERGVGVGG